MIKIYVDGSALSNPTGMAESRVLVEGQEPVDFKLGIHSNNFAEIWAIYEGVKLALNMKEDVEIFSDSQCALCWVKKSPSGKSKVIEKDKIIKIADMIRKLLKSSKNQIILIFWDKKQHGGQDICADFGRK